MKNFFYVNFNPHEIINIPFFIFWKNFTYSCYWFNDHKIFCQNQKKRNFNFQLKHFAYSVIPVRTTTSLGVMKPRGRRLIPICTLTRLRRHPPADTRKKVKWTTTTLLFHLALKTYRPANEKKRLFHPPPSPLLC